jgi:hypothetical protein
LQKILTQQVVTTGFCAPQKQILHSKSSIKKKWSFCDCEVISKKYFGEIFLGFVNNFFYQ